MARQVQWAATIEFPMEGIRRELHGPKPVVSGWLGFYGVPEAERQQYMKRVPIWAEVSASTCTQTTAAL